ncbi:Internalin-A_precursor [Hexamita inflata]|uniref:Internalin-A n=1 Tax=Hexamita inflata TaxID=28002 RepID=A0AA86QHB0_9EUKA|nr:Internalin-A precursor [Hexamita inflata]
MKNLKALYMDNTQVVDLHPLQHLQELEDIYASETRIIDVSPLSKLTQLNYLDFGCNKISNADTLKHHKNFSKYDFSDQEVPSTDELQLYNKILKVHSSHKQIRIIQYEKSVPKFKASLASKKNYVSTMLNNQIKMMNKEVGMLVQFIKNSNTYFNLYKLEKIQAYDACIIDVSPLSKLTQFEYLYFSCNKITNAKILKHHKNFSKYDFSNQEVPTTDELKFYNKILKVHSSHQQIRKIQNEKCVCKFRASLASKKNYVSAMLNNQIMVMNKELNLFIQFIHNSNTYSD